VGYGDVLPVMAGSRLMMVGVVIERRRRRRKEVQWALV